MSSEAETGSYSEANGGDGTCASGRSVDRAAVILCAAAAYQGSFWKLSLRLGRLASRGAAFAVFCCSLFRFGINASLTRRTVRPEIRA